MWVIVQGVGVVWEMCCGGRLAAVLCEGWNGVWKGRDVSGWDGAEAGEIGGRG
jgi:hypothetical protein